MSKNIFSLLAVAASCLAASAQDLSIQGKFGRETATNDGRYAGYRVWSISDPNHAIYSANPSGVAPSGASATEGLWDSGHRFRFRTALNQGFLFENMNEVALLDIDSDTGNLRTKGILYSESTGNSFFNGNLGIGSASPVSKVTIVANTAHTGNEFQRHGLAIQAGSSARTIWMGYDATADVGYINAAKSGSIQPVVLQSRGGRVGIGTTTPDYKLDVNGTIRAKEVIVESGWADYVFEEGYRLPDLSEVESHILSHRSLPGIPTAADVQANGLSLSASQTAMMVKIEELTLYAIDQEKELRRKDERIASLEARLARIEILLDN